MHGLVYAVEVVLDVRLAVPKGHEGVVSEPDWETLMVDAGPLPVTRAIANVLRDTIAANGWVGRTLPRLFREQGLVDVGVVPASAILTSLVVADQVFNLRTGAQLAADTGRIRREEAAGWVRTLEEADECGMFFSSLSGYIVSGRKA